MFLKQTVSLVTKLTIREVIGTRTIEGIPPFTLAKGEDFESKSHKVLFCSHDWNPDHVHKLIGIEISVNPNPKGIGTKAKPPYQQPTLVTDKLFERLEQGDRFNTDIIPSNTHSEVQSKRLNSEAFSSDHLNSLTSLISELANQASKHGVITTGWSFIPQKESRSEGKEK